MVSTPRGKSHYQSTQQPETPKSVKKRLHKGRFSDGHWWCNCEPRNKASLRETKKSGPNKGRFYWKCDNCSFFLWWDEAKSRETGLKSSEKGESSRSKAPALTQQSLVSYGYQVTPSRRASNMDFDDSTESGEESQQGPPMPKSAKTVDAGPSRAAALLETPSRGPTKRKRDVFEDDEDEDEFSDLGSDEERQMVAIADKSAEKAAAQRRYETPTNMRSADVISGLPTPVSRTLFPGTDSKRQKQVSFEDTPSRHSVALSSATISADTTPSSTPAGLQAAPSSSPPDNSYDVTDEIMGLLQDQKVDPGVLRTIKHTLNTAARRTKGIILGRDSARATLKIRDEKIASLQERITALENRERMHRSQMTNIKANLMKMYDDN
ncbi:hypothetical protein NW767_000954 [Fusarium falciforme]|uniref:GRF-type domain-containing protein n=1 Tax=Fusarium falciforme TaxID=195108 RepID=A0A9W8RGL1_9HYPO|nr:hypothetical protein NW755_000495 [Fusarium falciforme]KAJ4209043.1 hypothetical protein NW767_000954 [Fusarium falciforme]